MKLSGPFVIALFAALPVLAQSPHETELASGARLFAKYCTACHGANAKGGRAPDLTTGQWAHGAENTDIARNIQQGIDGTQMPGFPFSDADAASIVAWLRSLHEGKEEPLTGDAKAGQHLFLDAGKCSGCHMLKGQGGRFGPDLTRIGRERSAKDLRKSLGDLSKHIPAVEVQLKSGATLRGVVITEDTFSLYLRDPQEKLHFLRKQDIQRRGESKQPLMPTAKLEPKQVDDLIAFLKQPAGYEPDRSQWKPAADFNVSYARLKNSAAEPQNWLHYWGDFRGTHYSGLKSVTTANVDKLAARWTFQFGGSNIETTPIVADGMMFVTGPLNAAAALDAKTGHPIWRYRRQLPGDVHSNCTVMTNRGFAVLGDRLYLATLDTHLVSLDAKTGNVIFDIAVDDYKKGFSITHAPLAIDGKIIVGVTAGECALTGFVDAYDAATGKRLWRVFSVAQPGDPNLASWSGKSAETGGGPTWMTGTYDAATDTVFWTTGNPSPDYDGSVRLGDNLYTCSVLAIDPKTGKLKWHFQFTPHDTHDWDANETPVLIDANFGGKPRKLLIQANRNAFFYVLDRETGEFLLGKAFAKQTWAKGIDAKGRPIVIPNTDPTPEGNYVCPDATGATNWSSPSYDGNTGLFYVSVIEACAVYSSLTKDPKPGDPYVGTGQQLDDVVKTPGFIRAIDPLTGTARWNYPLQLGSHAAGVLSTAGGVLFAASKDGYLIGLDAKNGKQLWKYQTGAEIRSSPISYAVDGVQYIAVSNDGSLITFALP
ncbi:MAG: PQQ-dependent dehydrogenase, methanol/ethanol family [Bryobacteraceae bacterium]